MALAIVQTTPRVRALSTLTVAITFSTRPTVGNALVIPALIFTGSQSFVGLACADNQGNTYTLQVVRGQSQTAPAIFSCPKIVTSAGTFTVTITQAFASFFEVCAMEVSGVGTGLVIDQTISQIGSNAAPTTTATAALTSDDVLVVSAMVCQLNQTTITVQSVSPAWVEALENLDYTTSVAGEADQRLRTGVLGTTQTCAWTLTSSTQWAAVLAVFGAPAGPAPPSGGGQMKAKLGNKHGKTNEHGAVVVVPATTPGTPGVIGPLTIFPHLCGETTDTGLQVTSVTAGALRTPRTPLGNLRVTTDDQGSLRVASVTAGALGAFSPLGNLLCRTDETGALIVTSGPAGTLTSGPSPLLNLRGRTDENGALVVTGLSDSNAAYQARILADGAAAYWPLDDVVGSTSARDLAGTRHAVISGAVTLGQAGASGNSKSMAFVRTGILTPPTPVPVAATGFTLEAWVRRSATNVRQFIMARQLFSTNDWFWCATNSGGPVQVQFGYMSSSGFVPTTFPPVIPLDAWVYVVTVLTGTVAMSYINGVATATQPLILAGGAGGGSFTLGYDGEAPGEGWEGTMQDLAIYQKVLSASDIAAHYALRTAP